MAIGVSAIGIGARANPALDAIRPATTQAPSETTQLDREPFGNLVTKALDNLQAAQSDVDAKSVDFLAGGETELHSLMIASEKLSLGLNLTLQLRNKAVEAYQEIMRTQV